MKSVLKNILKNVKTPARASSFAHLYQLCLNNNGSHLTTKKTKPIVVNHVIISSMRLWFGEISPRIYSPKNMTIEVNRKAIEFNRTQSKSNQTQSNTIEFSKVFYFPLAFD